MPDPINGSANNERQPLLGFNSYNSPSAGSWRDTPKQVAKITWATLASNYVNVLLVFVPLGIIAGELHWGSTAIFVLNFIAIVPLASLLSFATEELSAKLGQTMGGLMNATFGNAVELIVRTAPHHPSTARVILTNWCRFPSLRSAKARSELCNPACWVRFCPTFYL